MASFVPLYTYLHTPTNSQRTMFVNKDAIVAVQPYRTKDDKSCISLQFDVRKFEGHSEHQVPPSTYDVCLDTNPVAYNEIMTVENHHHSCSHKLKLPFETKAFTNVNKVLRGGHTAVFEI